MIHDDDERRGPGRRGRQRPRRWSTLRRIRRPVAWRIRPTTGLAGLAGLVAGLMLPLGAPLSGLALPGSKPYCARDYARLHGDHYITYNNGFGSYTCLQTRDRAQSANFAMTGWGPRNDRIGAFPSIFAGWRYGQYPALSWDPVADDRDGSPEASVNFTQVPWGDYNAAWHIWFNRTDRPGTAGAGQDNGTEVMIWLVNHTYFHPTRTIRVEGRTWDVMTWIAADGSNGVKRRHIAFIAPNDLSSATLWLNPFLDEATALGDLNPHWYMTSVAFGYELASGDFDGMAVKNFAVNYVGLPGHGLDPHNPPKPR